MYYYKIFVYCSVIASAYGQYEGDKCTKNGMQGVCMNLRKCLTAIDDIKLQRGAPKLCSFANVDPIVCCLDNVNITPQQPVATTSTIRPSSTTEYIPPDYDYVVNDKFSPIKDGCEPLSLNTTAEKTGQKSWDKCIEYQQKFVYPCEKGVALTGKLARSNKCNHNANQLIVGGINASKAEFPHMAMLGFGKDEESSQWLCGGSVLNERYILTAGHCTYSRDLGRVNYARTGALRRTDPIDLLRTYKIRKIIKHPEYKAPKRYNDIALLKTDRDIILDQLTIPACLDVGSPNKYEQALATGWGATKNRGSSADQLQKVILEKFSTAECSEMFPSTRLMINGFNENTQICYGDKNMSKDTCQGDSGGPLQLKHKQINCMYTVVGVTSFGRACGYVGEPGIYTRVAAYVPWIERIIWPYCFSCGLDEPYLRFEQISTPNNCRRLVYSEDTIRRVVAKRNGLLLAILSLFYLTSANSDGLSSFQLLARLSFPTVETKPYNMPSTKEIDPKHSYADEKFEKLMDYTRYMNGRIKEPHNPAERQEILETSQKKLFTFIDTHIKDLKRLLFETDMALMSMVLLKLNKKMDTSEAKIKSTQAKIPFGLYTSPEYKCLGTSYYIASPHNQEDVQMILSSERKPHCYTFRGAFAFSGFYHRHSETTYVGPHAEQFQAKDPSQGLYCHSDDNWSDAQCIYKINPREEFPESVEYEPKVSYYCGPYRYFIPATTDIRCIFSIFSMNFILRFGYDGVTYKSSDLTFMYQNGQVFYTDEPWAGMSCWNWACKWRHNQNQRSNEFFVN